VTKSYYSKHSWIYSKIYQCVYVQFYRAIHN